MHGCVYSYGRHLRWGWGWAIMMIGADLMDKRKCLFFVVNHSRTGRPGMVHRYVLKVTQVYGRKGT